MQEHGDACRAEPHMTLVGLALKAQKPDQAFRLAAQETLQNCFHDIPPNILMEQVEALQKARDRLVVNRYGSVITMKLLKSPSRESTSPESTGETIATEIYETPNCKDALDWSPSRPSPLGRKIRAPIHVPDLKDLVITDSEDDEAIVVRTLRCTESPTQVPKNKAKPEPQDAEPLTPKICRPSKNSTASAKTASMPPTLQILASIENSATVEPIICGAGVTGSLEAGVTSIGNKLRHTSTTRSPEQSPIRRMLNNKASRLRTQANIQKITRFESPKHDRLTFEIASPPKSPSPLPPRDRCIEDPTMTFTDIDKFFRAGVPSFLKANKPLDKNKQEGKKNPIQAPPSKRVEKPPLSRHLTNEHEFEEIGIKPSSLMFQMDEDMNFREEPLLYVGKEVNDTPSISGNLPGGGLQYEANANSETPQILSEISGAHNGNRSAMRFIPSRGDSQKKPIVGRTALQGSENHNPVNTEAEVIEPVDPCEPTILNLKVGLGGLTINVHCAGELFVGGSSINNALSAKHHQ